ncbi:MAG: hypothetical protein FD155_3296 [Bacteroidetes bacterium]|nr:MAG: hypothetical protein FD155_3296 [Bacteroidota bacterium]
MERPTLVCDLLTCQSIACSQRAMKSYGTMQLWLPEPFYNQLNASELKNLKPLVQKNIVRVVKYNLRFLERFNSTSRSGISMIDYYVVFMASKHDVNLLCSPQWYQTVSQYFDLPAIDGLTTNEETDTLGLPFVSGYNTTSISKMSVLLITTSFRSTKPIDTK